MAADSKCTDSLGMFVTKMPKLYRLSNKSVFGHAGDIDVRLILDLLSKSTLKKLPTRTDLALTKTDMNGLWSFLDGTVYLVTVAVSDTGTNFAEWTGELLEVSERFIAVGGGSPYAMGAMAAGKTAAEAVNIACRLDAFCQLPVKSITVKEIGKKN